MNPLETTVRCSICDGELLPAQAAIGYCMGAAPEYICRACIPKNQSAEQIVESFKTFIKGSA